MMLTSRRLAAAFLVAGLCAALPVQAYVGPGAGITLIGALIGLVSAILLALWAVLRWPIRKFLARRKAAQAGGNDGSGKPTATGPK
jgi:hypothetical protein